MGYEVVALQCRYKDYPTLPEEPEAGEYDTEDEYKEAKVEYEQDMNDYMEEGKGTCTQGRSRRNIALRTD